MAAVITNFSVEGKDETYAEVNHWDFNGTPGDQDDAAEASITTDDALHFRIFEDDYRKLKEFFEPAGEKENVRWTCRIIVRDNAKLRTLVKIQGSREQLEQLDIPDVDGYPTFVTRTDPSEVDEAIVLAEVEEDTASEEIEG